MNQPVKTFKDGTVVESPSTVARKPRRRLAWIILPSLLVAGGVFWWTQHGSAPQPANDKRSPPAMSIVPEVVGKGDINITLDALGTVTSLATVTIRTQISGQLVNVAFTEGQDVKKGDLLAEIDSRPYEAALAQAQGQLARDEALLKGAQVDLTRYQGLAAQNAVARQTLDTQVALVAQDQGTVAADRAQVKTAEVNLAYCRIISPLNGRVGLRLVDQGNYVTPGDANGLVVITQIKPISVLFTLPEDSLQRITKRMQAGATLAASAYDRASVNKIADGTLQSLDSQIDPTTGTIKLRAQFPNETGALYPNQFVNIRLLVDTHKDVTVMPSAGIQRGVPGTFVYLINPDNTVSVRKVTLGATDGEHVEVVSGLTPGDQIVVDGTDKLRDGAKINIRSEAGTSTPSKQSRTGNQTQRPDSGRKP